MTKPLAVIINDIHYNLNTLEVADKAMGMAIDKANELNVTLVVAGDLHDTKANIRGECINAMQKTFARCKTSAFILRGNHDALNEKSREHSLGFLTTLALVVSYPTALTLHGHQVALIPYHHDREELKVYLKTLSKGSTLIMHQGVMGTEADHYIQDHSALRKDDLAGFNVFSGHYHRRQSFKLPNGGNMTYLGNPYTLGFGEANHPEKGFNVLYDDGSLEFIPTNLRKHVIIETHVTELVAVPYVHTSGDLLWFKLHGAKEELSTVTKKLIADNYLIEEGFKLDLIPDDVKADIDIISVSQSQPELLDTLIASLTNVGEEQKKRLKAMWKDLTQE